LNMGVARVFSQETSVDVLPHELQKLARDRTLI